MQGDKGYKSVVSSYGVELGDYYFEIEVEKSKVPIPFVGVTSSIRVGFTSFTE